MKRSIFQAQRPRSVATSGPDYTLPLRMQSWGRASARSAPSRLHWFLWQRAIRSKRVWRTATRCTLGLGALQTLVLAAVPGRHVAAIVLIPLGTLVASLISAAMTAVHSLDTAARIGQN